MNQLNKNIEYALMALSYINLQKPHRSTSATEISETLLVPFYGIAKAMQRLSKSKILKSEQGSKGGYTLNVDLNSISFNDIIESIFSESNIVKCISNEVYCEISDKCNIKPHMKQLNQKLKEFYSSINIQELLNLDAKTTNNHSEITKRL